MNLKSADIYRENIFTDEVKNYPSLKTACLDMSKIPNKDRDIYLLCVGNWNLDYIQPEESYNNYYKRMKTMLKNISTI